MCGCIVVPEAQFRRLMAETEEDAKVIEPLRDLVLRLRDEAGE